VNSTPSTDLEVAPHALGDSSDTAPYAIEREIEDLAMLVDNPSGLVNTSFMMGGALGLAVLASLAASRTDALLASGKSQAAALTGGYHLAFLVGAIFAAAAAVLGVLLRAQAAPAAQEELEEVPAEPAPCCAFSVGYCRAAEQVV
jgi:hypothetical protein